jgi:hypothetical protein
MVFFVLKRIKNFSMNTIEKDKGKGLHASEKSGIFLLILSQYNFLIFSSESGIRNTAFNEKRFNYSLPAIWTKTFVENINL